MRTVLEDVVVFNLGFAHHIARARTKHRGAIIAAYNNTCGWNLPGLDVILTRRPDMQMLLKTYRNRLQYTGNSFCIVARGVAAARTRYPCVCGPVGRRASSGTTHCLVRTCVL